MKRSEFVLLIFVLVREVHMSGQNHTAYTISILWFYSRKKVFDIEHQVYHIGQWMG